MKVASINLKIKPISDEIEVFKHLESVIQNSADLGATLIVLPEYAIAELYCLFDDYTEEQGPRFLTKYSNTYVSFIESMAKKYKATIIGGSFFKEQSGNIYNVCPISSFDNNTYFQYKNCLVTYEKENQKLSSGENLELPSNSIFGSVICYDCEFPEPIQIMAKNGIKILCVPSSTETVHGFRRVRYSCLARAIENQIFVIHSAIVGSINKEPLPDGYGSSAIISPCAPEFPNGPILAETALNEEGIAVADLDFNALEDLRNHGEVTNFKDINSKVWKIV
jgi:predicted amidohydrolase